MQENLIFLIGPPRSGTTMLQRMLGSHPAIFTRPEPHIITPLAHLGYYYNVERAPYDHINAAEALREFVAELPAGEADYLDACRAYTDVLYGRMLEKSGRKMLLDKTPAYALVLPFLSRLYPRANFVVLTRHPLAVLSSYAQSFFEGDYQLAVGFNDILGRYIPAMADLLRRREVRLCHLRYEDLVSAPESNMREILSFLDLPYEECTVDYGDQQHPGGSYGDPKVKYHRRPSTDSLHRWAADLAADGHKMEVARKVIEPILAEDIEIWGYDKKTLFDPVAEVGGDAPGGNGRWRFDSYRIKRKVFLALRKDIQRNRLGKLVRRVKYYCDTLLRE